MDKPKNNKGVIILLIVIIIILSSLCVLFATNTISFKSNNTINDTSNNDDVNDKIDVNLSINNVIISEDAPNSKLFLDGTINLSYDNNKYAGVALSGYCLGNNNEKYLIHGPGDGHVLFHDDNSILSLTENIPQNIEYSDGTTKSWEEIDWSNVKIKYCKIEKMITVLNNGTSETNNPEIALNVEKFFD